MTAHTLLSKLAIYKGCKVNDCIDAIESIAHAAGYSVGVLDPQFNTTPGIDNEGDRLNVRTDKRTVITSFTIG